MEKMICEVRAISIKNKVDLDRAFDMFRSNCEAAAENYKGTGTYCYEECPDDKTFGELRKAILKVDRQRAENGGE